MKKMSVIFSVFLMMLLITFIVSKNTETTANNERLLNNLISGEKVRIGYAEGEPWVDFAGHLYALAQGLQERDIISGVENLPYQFGQFDSSEMWNWLAENANSNKVEFVKDVYFSFSSTPPGAEDELLTLLKNNEVDIMLVMGTYSGRLLAVNEHNVATLVFSSSNAEFAGIIDSIEDSGRDHVWAHMHPGRYGRQVEAFHDTFQFEKLGMVIEDSVLGRVFSDMASVEEVATSRGFELIIEHVDEPYSVEADRTRYYRELLDAHKRLAKEVDAFLIAIAAIEAHDLPSLLEPFYDANIPVFSQMGTESVENGALMTLARTDFNEMGYFGAGVIEQVILGTKPRDIPQVYIDTPKIILNLSTAEKINYKAPFEILLVADEIYYD